MAEEPFLSKASLIMLNDLKAKNFGVVLMKANEEKIYEESKVLDYIGAQRLVFTSNLDAEYI